MKIIGLFVLNLIFSFVFGDGEGEYDNSIFNEINSVRLRQEREIQAIQEIYDHPLLLFHYVENSKASIEAAHYLKEATDKLDFIVKVIMINCDTFIQTNYPKCNRGELSDGFPKISLLAPPTVRFDIFSKKVNMHHEVPWPNLEFTENNIYNFAIQEYENKAIKLTSSNLESFLNNDLFAKVILFTDKKAVPLIYKGLSLEFHEKLLLGYVYSKDQALCRKFGVESFPTLLVIENIENDLLSDEPKYTVYDGALKIDEIVSFLSKFALREKRYKIATRMSHIGLDPETQTKNYRLKELNHTNIFEWFNYQNKDNDVLIYFGNHSPQRNDTQFMKFQIRGVLKSLHGYYKQGYINCEEEENGKICKEGFLQTSYPNIVTYSKEYPSLEKRIKSGSTLNPYNATKIRQQFAEKFRPYVTYVESHNYGQFAKSALGGGKALLIHFHESQSQYNIPFFLIGADWNISRRWSLAEAYNPTDRMMEDFGVQSLPALVALFPDSTSLEHGTVNPLNLNIDIVYSSLFNFAKSYNQVIEERLQELSQIPEIKSRATFRSECLDSKSEVCLIAMLDGRRNNRASMDRFEELMSIYSKLNQNKGSFTEDKSLSITWVNATCHKDFTKEFIKDDKIPNFIVYWPKRGQFIKHDSNYIEQHSLAYFIKTTLEKRHNYFEGLDNENPTFEEDCKILQEEFIPESKQEQQEEKKKDDL